MDFNTYQHLAQRTANKNLPYDWRKAVAVIGLVAEAGEAAELFKKHFGHGHELDRAEVIKELGDCMWYLAEVSALLGIDLSEVAEKNIEKLKRRYPEGFSEERSINREE